MNGKSLRWGGDMQISKLKWARLKGLEPFTPILVSLQIPRTIGRNFGRNGRTSRPNTETRKHIRNT